jgi:hypothetical protein
MEDCMDDSYLVCPNFFLQSFAFQHSSSPTPNVEQWPSTKLIDLPRKSEPRF